jgi:hypothetical protein
MKGFVSEEALAEYSRLAAEKLGVDFSEGEVYDFARCMRADGSFYGTRGKCRKGSDAGDAPAKEKSGKSGTREEKVNALREKVKELEKSGDKKKLAEARHDLQGQERMKKLEDQAKKSGKTLDQVIKERNDSADKKVKTRLESELMTRLKARAAEGDKEAIRALKQRTAKDEGGGESPAAPVKGKTGRMSAEEKRELQIKASRGDKEAMDALNKARAEGRIGKEAGFEPGAKKDIPDMAKIMGTKETKPRATANELRDKQRALFDDAKAKRAAAKEAEKAAKAVAKETKDDKSPEARKRRLEAGRAWDKANTAADRAQTAWMKAHEKWSKAGEREQRAKMSPEQRKEARNIDRIIKERG